MKLTEITSKIKINYIILVLLSGILLLGIFGYTNRDQYGARRYYTNSGTALVAGDFTIGPGWGTTTTLTVTGTDANFGVFVTSNGTGQSNLNAYLRLTFHDGGWGTIPIVSCGGWSSNVNEYATSYGINSTNTQAYNVFGMFALPVTTHVYTTFCHTLGQ